MNRSTLRSLIRYAKRPLSSATVTGVLFIGLNAVVMPSASAAIYKCISVAGAVTYSGRKCPEFDTTDRIIADSGIGSARNRQAPTPAAANPTPSPAQLREAEMESQTSNSPHTGSE